MRGREPSDSCLGIRILAWEESHSWRRVPTFGKRTTCRFTRTIVNAIDSRFRMDRNAVAGPRNAVNGPLVLGNRKTATMPKKQIVHRAMVGRHTNPAASRSCVSIFRVPGWRDAGHRESVAPTFPPGKPPRTSHGASRNNQPINRKAMKAAGINPTWQS
jgi:hypothetical protein